MVVKENEIGVKVINVAGVVETIRENVIELKNDKKTKYRLGTVGIKYPDGETDSVDARFYVKSIEAHKDVFKDGGKIMLEIQAEGQYAGRAVAKLGGNIANVDRLLGKVTVAKATVNAEGDKVTTIA